MKEMRHLTLNAPSTGKGPCPLVVLFSTPGHFCLLVEAHRLFDGQQQALIADMQPARIRFVWDAQEASATLCIGSEVAPLADGDFSVFRFEGPLSRSGEPELPGEADWNALQYALFTSGTPDEQVWRRQSFTFSELRHHDEFARLTCRGAVLSGLGIKIRGDGCHE